MKINTLLCSLVFLWSYKTFCQSQDDLAYKIIGERQRKFGAKQITAPLDSQIAEYVRSYNRASKGISKKTETSLSADHIQVPKTKFETVIQRTHIHSIEKKAFEILRSAGLDTTLVYFSMVSCPCFNALSRPLREVKNGEKKLWLVEYNVGFSSFAQKTSIFTSNLTPDTGSLDSLSLDPKAYFQIISNENNFDLYNSLFAFLLGDIGSALNIESDSIKLSTCRNPVLAGSISSGFSSFTLFHELSHIILDHHAKINALSFAESDKSESVEISNYYDFEFAADSLAIEIMFSDFQNPSVIRESPTNTISTGYLLSPLIFFSWLDLFQNFETKITGSHRGIKTHPSAKSRRDRLNRMYIRKGLINDDLNYSDFVEGSLNFMNKILNESILNDKLIYEIKQIQKLAKFCIIK